MRPTRTIAVAAVLGSLVTAAPAAAEETTCRGALSRPTVDRIDGNLQCKTNTPRPVGGRNVVQGNKEDQCARL